MPPAGGGIEEGRIIDDLNDLSVILGVPRRDLRAAIGSPWRRVQPASYDLAIGPMFVGRDDDAVAILCLASSTEVIGPGGVVSHTMGTVLVGSAIGSTLPSGQTGWRLGGAQKILSRGVGLDAQAFLTALKTTVNRAVAEHDPLRSDLRGRSRVVSV